LYGAQVAAIKKEIPPTPIENPTRFSEMRAKLFFFYFNSVLRDSLTLRRAAFLITAPSNPDHTAKGNNFTAQLPRLVWLVFGPCVNLRGYMVMSVPCLHRARCFFLLSWGRFFKSLLLLRICAFVCLYLQLISHFSNVSSNGKTSRGKFAADDGNLIETRLFLPRLQIFEEVLFNLLCYLRKYLLPVEQNKRREWIFNKLVSVPGDADKPLFM